MMAEPQHQILRGDDCADDVQSHRSAAAAPVLGDPWLIHKQLMQRLYLDDKKPLGEVMEIMQREHRFNASIHMYKKKFRQWKFQTNRKGWQTRASQKSLLQSSSAFKRRPGARSAMYLVMDLPEDSKAQQLSLRLMCDDVRRAFKPVLPGNHRPILSFDGPPLARLKFPTPASLLTFQASLVAGMELAVSDKASTCGAFFERSFAQIEDVLKSDYCLNASWILDTLQAATFFGAPEIMRILLTQLYQMTLRLFGREHPVAFYVSAILKAPERRQSDIISLYATAVADVVDDVLGKYDFTSLLNRARLLKVKSHNRNVNPAEFIPEWEQMVENCRLSPQEDSVLLFHGINMYADTLIEVMKDYERAEATLAVMLERLKNTRKEDDVGMPAIWGLVAGTKMYADALNLQAKDDQAIEAAYRLAISKGLELLGPDNPLVMGCKTTFGQFLSARNRLDETEKIYEEINNELKDFMLGETN